jgi:hypothetical protein
MDTDAAIIKIQAVFQSKNTADRPMLYIVDSRA